MIHIIFDPINGTPMQDGVMETFVAGVAHGQKDLSIHQRIYICNELLVGYFRLAIKDGRIPHDQIIFEYDGEKLQANEKGRFTHWPKGFCDRTLMVMSTLGRG